MRRRLLWFAWGTLASLLGMLAWNVAHSDAAMGFAFNGWLVFLPVLVAPALVVRRRWIAATAGIGVGAILALCAEGSQGWGIANWMVLVALTASMLFLAARLFGMAHQFGYAVNRSRSHAADHAV